MTSNNDNLKLTSSDESLLTDLNTIINETDSIIKGYTDALEKLGIGCTVYINAYDKYIDMSLYDATRLKERMKETIVQAVNNEF